MRKYNATAKGGAYNRAHVKEWRKRNPGRSHGNRTNSRTGEYRAILIDWLLRRDGLICGICKLSLEGSKIELDHIEAVACGGPHIMENMQLAHPKCNIRKGLETRKRVHGY